MSAITVIRGVIRSAFLPAALLVAVSWPAHAVAEAHHPGDYCLVCAVASSPELNSDCGTDLLPRPCGFDIVVPAAPPMRGGVPAPRAFLGRAPPPA